MAEANARVMDMVRRELEKNRDVATDTLFEKAVAIDPDVAGLTARQFHAKYPLQVKRAMKGAGRRRAAKKRATKKRATRRSARKTTPKRATKKRAAKKRAAKKTTAKRTGRKRTAAKSAGRPAKKTARKTAQKAARKTAKRSARVAASGSDRDRVRSLLLRFAKEVAAADGKADMIDVMSGVEGWVDRVLAASA